MSNTENKGRTLEVIKAEVNEKINALNKERDLDKHPPIVKELEQLIKEYNELSLYTAYATAKDAELPVMALAKACTYPCIDKKRTPGTEVIDGVLKVVDNYSQVDKNPNLNILKFIKWLEERNIKMPDGWQTRMSAVKAEIIDQWQEFNKSGDEHSFNKKRMRKLTQAMVNDMGFIEGEKGGNALVVKNEHINPMIQFANRRTGVQSGETLTPRIWDDMLLTLLNGLATGKVFENTYGGAAVFKEETPATTEEATTSETPATEETTAE